MSILDKIIALNQIKETHYQPLYFGDHAIGKVHLNRIDTLKLFHTIFTFQSKAIYFSDSFMNASFEQRNQMISVLCHHLKTNALIKEWRQEQYPIFQFSDTRESLLFTIERGCVGYLGLCAYGIHVNGFTHTDEGLKIWVAKRSMTRPIAPGKLDQITGGGLPFGLTPYENVIKECLEEASIPEQYAKHAHYIQLLHYQAEDERGVKPDYMYIFDLELPLDFIPQSNDGEVESFSLLPPAYLIDLVTNTDIFKANSGLVMIDFLVRHQFIPALPELTQLIVSQTKN